MIYYYNYSQTVTRKLLVVDLTHGANLVAQNRRPFETKAYKTAVTSVFTIRIVGKFTNLNAQGGWPGARTKIPWLPTERENRK